MISGATFVPTQQLAAIAPIRQPSLSEGALTQAAAGENEFSASYAPQIYAIYINGVIANASVASTSLATNLSVVQVAQPPIPGDPQMEIPGLPPVQPVPGPEGTQQIVNSVGRLAGSGRILSSAPPAHARASAKKAA